MSIFKLSIEDVNVIKMNKRQYQQKVSTGVDLDFLYFFHVNVS